jgi:CMP-N-acetylneuraminic acid synthetase
MKVLGITLARGGSKGVPKKNIKMIAGKPLIAWTIEEALASKNLNNYIVSTDDPQIARISAQYKADAINRPAKFAEDDTPSLTALQHAVHYMENIHGKYDIVADIRCTNPFYKDIDGAIKGLIRSGADSVIGVEEAYPVERIKFIEDGRIKSFAPEPEDGQRQYLGKSYKRNGSLYVVQRDILMGYRGDNGWIEGKLFNHENSKPWFMGKSVNIDTETDFWLAERMLLNDMGG